VRWLVFDAESVASIDTTGLAALDQIVRDLARDGIDFAIARGHDAFVQSITTSGLRDLSAVPQFATVRAAIDSCAQGTANA
jgi:anti-anti-sigma regulatory factor